MNAKYAAMLNDIVNELERQKDLHLMKNNMNPHKEALAQQTQETIDLIKSKSIEGETVKT